jgi:hypothetical protein
MPPAAEPPTAPAPPALALAFARIAQLRAAGYDLVYTEQPSELARLVRGRELVIVMVKELRHGRP